MSESLRDSLSTRVLKRVNDLLGDPLSLRIPVPTEKDSEKPRGSQEASSISVIRREWEEFFNLSRNRRRRYLDYDRMDTGDTATLLDVVVDACTISDDGRLTGFEIDAGKKVQNLLKDTAKRTRLDLLVRPVLRSVLKYGDEFVEIVLSENGDVVYLQPLPVDTMIVRTDEHNRLKTGKEAPIGGEREFPAAYWQVDAAGRTLAGWYPWEMAHLKYRDSWKGQYSETSLFEDIRGKWHKLRVMEESMAVARMVRAYMRLKHKLDVTGKDDVQQKEYLKDYMDRIRKTKLVADETTGSRGAETRVWGVDEDLFVTTGYRQVPDGTSQPMLGDVEMMDPQNTGIRFIPDVEHIQRGLFTRVSGESVGLPGDREDIGMQDIATSRFYQWCQKGILEAQLIRPVFDLALSLKGYSVGEEAYKIKWPKVVIESSWRFADAEFRRSMADNNRIEGGVATRKQVGQERYGYSEEEWEEVVKEFQREQEVFGPIDRGTDTQMKRIGNQAT